MKDFDGFDDPPFAAIDPADQARTPNSAASARLIATRSARVPPWTVRWPQIASPSCHSTSATSPSVTIHSSTRPGTVSAISSNAPFLSARSISPNGTCTITAARTR